MHLARHKGVSVSNEDISVLDGMAIMTKLPTIGFLDTRWPIRRLRPYRASSVESSHVRVDKIIGPSILPSWGRLRLMNGKALLTAQTTGPLEVTRFASR